MPRCLRTACRRAWLIAAWLSLAPPAWSQNAEPPLIEQDPYDELTLDAANGGAVLKLEPVELSGRRLPDNPRPGDTLRVRLPERPDEEFEVAWRNIARLRLFEQIVLERAAALSAARRFDEAFDHLRFVYERDPRFPGLAEALEDFLWRQAQEANRSGRGDEAALLLADLVARKANYPGLSEALTRLLDQRLARLIAAGDFQAARDQMRTLGARFGPAVAAVVAQRRAELIALAKDAWTAARAHQQGGRLPEALAACDQALVVWPELTEARATAEELLEQYPRVAVAVEELGRDGPSSPLVCRGAWRTARLERRRLFEFVGSGAEGGRYESPFAAPRWSDDRTRLELVLRGGADGPTAPDVARRLLALADPASADYSSGWAAALRQVEVAGLDRVSLALGPHVRPEAWLNVELDAGPGGPAVTARGPYGAMKGDERSRRFVSRAEFARSTLQPAEVVERRYPDTAAALGALRRGEVSLVARVAPRLLPRARSLPDVVVSAYALPTVHVLLPNPARPFTARRTFRRALAYALDRPGILKRDLLEGQEIVGCRPLDGPFPAGVSFDDPLAYGFDPAVPQRAHDPRLALALSRVALYEVRATDKLEGRPETQDIPELTLAHPADEVARTACRAIRAQWQAIGLKVRLQELSPAEPSSALGPYDLTYAELAVWEPVVDAQRLFAPGGLAPASPYLELALRRLESATTWEDVRARLRDVHRLVYDDVTLIPLWQTVNHLAYHRALGGIADRPLQLYDSVENWRIEPRLPEP
jgi:hypothetical protein